MLTLEIFLSKNHHNCGKVTDETIGPRNSNCCDEKQTLFKKSGTFLSIKAYYLIFFLDFLIIDKRNSISLVFTKLNLMDPLPQKSISNISSYFDWEVKEMFSQKSLENIFEEIQSEGCLNYLLERASIN